MDVVRHELASLKAQIGDERARLQVENGRLSQMVSDLRKDHAMDLQAAAGEFENRIASTAVELRHTKADLDRRTRECDSLRKESQGASNRVRELERQLDTLTTSYDRLSRQQQTTPPSSSSELSEMRQKIDRLKDSVAIAERDAITARRQLQDREYDLRSAKNRITDLESERRTIAKELADFERDLSTQRKDSQRFGIELQKLKIEQQGTAARHASELAAAEREARTARDKLKTVERELASAKSAQREMARSRSQPSESALQSALEAQRARFKVQIADLAVQIRYLKAKFTREATFRNALSLQKRYLLLVVGGMSLS